MSSEAIDVSMDPCMREGEAVVLYSAKGKFNAVFLERKRKTRIFGFLKDLDPLLDAPYGSVFELNPNSDKPRILKELSGKESAETVTDGRDNRDVVDDAQNQRLSMDDIEDLKARADDGTSIVEALIENSETYDRKTEFAQEKYLSRKVKKYCTTFSALRPTIATIAEVVKASFLRVDTLSVMLSLANVGAYRRVLVVDNCMGLLAAAVSERLGGFGDICVGYFGKKPCKLESLRRFSKSSSNIYKLPLVDLIWLKSNLGQSEATDRFEEISKQRDIPPERLDGWLRRGFDSFVMADWTIHPSAVIEGVLPLIEPSASFAIYASGLVSLAECQHRLLQRSDVIMVELQDLWWREYQVLPGRTRPAMDAKCPSGYLLSGIKVQHLDPSSDPNTEDDRDTEPKKVRSNKQDD